MGKSPGKWIKTILFRKKSPRSNISKGREIVNKKEELVASNASVNAPALDQTTIMITGNQEHIEWVNEESEILSLENQELNIRESVNEDAPPDPEKIRLEEAAITTQAAFRGYMARKAYRHLKGIIRLQALTRGHLVRRQAVATLFCMYGIVKLQALIRGQRARHANVGFEIHEHYNLSKPLDGKLGEPSGISSKLQRLSSNTFISKLLASLPTMALHLQYVVGDPNSVSSWLERWSASYFWKPVPQPKKIPDNKSQRKHGDISIGEAQISKSKRTNRKLPTENFESVSVQTNPKLEIPKQNFRKISSQLSDPEQENPQSELEKVKRNLRKIHKPVSENTFLSEAEGETPKQHLEKKTITTGHAVSEPGVVTSNEKIKKEAALIIPDVPHVKIPPRPSDNSELSDIPSSYQVTVESKTLTETTEDRNTSDEDKKDRINLPDTTYANEKSPLTNGDSNHKEDVTGRENKKSTRKALILAKREHAENGFQNSPTLPSYMAATESAKAKLRMQETSSFEQDESERNHPSGRNSLPSTSNSKINSHSPKTRRSTKASGKVDHRSDKAVPSSRGGNGKVIQAEWRR